MRELGFEIRETRSAQAFGSWYIRATWHGRPVRVVWDGRDGALVIEEPSLSGRPDDWGDRWVAGDGYSSKPGDLKEGLRSLIAKYRSTDP
jgi:hypothetical protein